MTQLFVPSSVYNSKTDMPYSPCLLFKLFKSHLKEMFTKANTQIRLNSPLTNTTDQEPLGENMR